MTRQHKICLNIAWLAAAIAILFMGTDMCVSTDAACYQAGQTMLFFMFWLSFSTSLLFVIAALMCLDGAVHSPSDFIISWAVMVLSGLLQWLVIVPHLFERNRLTLLNLAMVPSQSFSSVDTSTEIAGQVTTPRTAPTIAPVIEATPGVAKTANIRNRCAGRRRTKTRPFAAFDRRGRTPFERVIDYL